MSETLTKTVHTRLLRVLLDLKRIYREVSHFSKKIPANLTQPTH